MWQYLMNFTSNMVVSYENYVPLYCFFQIYSFIMQVPLFIVDINSLLFLVIYRITKIFLGCFFINHVIIIELFV